MVAFPSIVHENFAFQARDSGIIDRPIYGLCDIPHGAKQDHHLRVRVALIRLICGGTHKEDSP